MKYAYIYSCNPHGFYSWHLGSIFFLILLLVLLYLAYKTYKRSMNTACLSTEKTGRFQGKSSKTSLEILESRMVNSEITVEEFLNMKKAMQKEMPDEKISDDTENKTEQ